MKFTIEYASSCTEYAPPPRCHRSGAPMAKEQHVNVFAGLRMRAGVAVVTTISVAAPTLYLLACALEEQGHTHLRWVPCRCCCDACCQGDTCTEQDEQDALPPLQVDRLIGYFVTVAPHRQACADPAWLSPDDPEFGAASTCGYAEAWSGWCRDPRAELQAEIDAVDRALLLRAH
jgi:hypothetical protein